MKENNDKRDQDIRLDDIDIFFCSNFNELLDDKPFNNNDVLKDKPFNEKNISENKGNNIEILSLSDEPEILNVPDISNIELLEDIEESEILNTPKIPNIEILEDIKKPEILGLKEEQRAEKLDLDEILNLNNTPNTKKTKKYVKKGTKRKILIIDLIILFILLSFTIYKIVLWSIDNNKTNKQIKEIQADVSINEVEDNDNTIVINNEEINSTDQSKNNDYWNFINKPLISVDFSSLINKNNDTVGWIQVNGTNINYPVVKYFDNTYYLDHSYDKSYNDAGWIFMDYRNNLVDDKNTIIYGHARLNSTMFGTLKNVVKSNWYTNSDNHLVKLSTINSNTSWQVFSTYVINSEDYYIKTDFEDDTYLDFLNNLKERSVYDYNVNLTDNDRILTLSTCYTDNKRVVLHAKLIKMENR